MFRHVFNYQFRHEQNLPDEPRTFLLDDRNKSNRFEYNSLYAEFYQYGIPSCYTDFAFVSYDEAHDHHRDHGHIPDLGLGD